MAPSALTLNYDAVLSSTLMNLHKKGVIFDQISTSNALLFKIMKMNGMYTGDAEGERMRCSLMYEFGGGGVFSGYDVLGSTPAEGVTTGFFNWGQLAVPIAISGKEERENASSETRIFDLLKGKTKQALLKAQDLFAKALIQGNGPNTATAITTALTDTGNGAVFIDPLPLLVHYNPAASVAVGNINQATYTWWRNKTSNSASTTYAGFLKELDHLSNECSKGPGGAPDLHFADQNVYELYCAALRSQNRYTDYKKADLPFDTVAFKGNAVTWDEFIPDAANGTIASIPVASSGTWYMLNTKFLNIKHFQDFEPTPFAKPTGGQAQDAKLAHILWHGGIACSQRRKQGVMGSIDTTIAA
jgi:hypothetical protein